LYINCSSALKLYLIDMPDTDFGSLEIGKSLNIFSRSRFLYLWLQDNCFKTIFIKIKYYINFSSSRRTYTYIFIIFYIKFHISILNSCLCSSHKKNTFIYFYFQIAIHFIIYICIILISSGDICLIIYYIRANIPL